MRFLFLALLVRGPTHGYALKQLHDELFGHPWPPMNIGQIYVTMGRLERDGLVEVTPDGEAEPAGGSSQSNRPARKIYSLTELGRKELDQWMTDPGESSMPKSDLLLRLVAASITGDVGVQSVIDDCRRTVLLALRSLSEAVATDAEDSLAGLLVQQAILHLQADLTWLDRAEGVLFKQAAKGNPQILAPVGLNEKKGRR
jgi:DNA-binding PadR family transcriptional regulator